MKITPERWSHRCRQASLCFKGASRAAQLAAVGSVAGAAATYPILIAAKLAEIMPSHFTWLKIAIIPGALWGLLLFPLAIETFKQRNNDV